MNDPHHPEPEIIPPGAGDPARWQDRSGARQTRVWMWSSGPQGTRLRYTRPGPLGLFLVFLTLAGLSALGMLVFLGLAAIALPLIGALVLVGVIGGVLRRL